ncbi:MAG: hypothetical protein JEZ05_09095 [Tenericutes bacterium]|nr:hypothetical protein [Mycoplasmatota bacterium]
MNNNIEMKKNNSISSIFRNFVIVVYLLYIIGMVLQLYLLSNDSLNSTVYGFISFSSVELDFLASFPNISIIVFSSLVPVGIILMYVGFKKGNDTLKKIGNRFLILTYKLYFIMMVITIILLYALSVLIPMGFILFVFILPISSFLLFLMNSGIVFAKNSYLMYNQNYTGRLIKRKKFSSFVKFAVILFGIALVIIVFVLLFAIFTGNLYTFQLEGFPIIAKFIAVFIYLLIYTLIPVLYFLINKRRKKNLYYEISF